MYEFTMGGAWFKWSTLDRISKRLAAASMISAVIAAIPMALYVSEPSYRIGVAAGYAAAGGTGPAPVGQHPFPITIAPWMAMISLCFGVLSALLWWQFSRRQDEMFNRVQNWSLGMAGAWTMAICYGWLALWGAGIAAAPTAIALAGIFYVALLMFWFAAVRRWA